MSLMDSAPTFDAPAGDPAPVADTAPAADPTTASTPEPDVFPRSYVEELRQEAAGYRQERNTYKEAFDGYSPEEQQFLLDFARDLRNPDAAPTAVERMAQALGLTPAEAAQAQAEADADPEFDPFDPQSISQMVQQQVEQVLSQREQQTEQQQAINQVFDAVKAAGYDPDSADGLELQIRAHKDHNGDIAAAHEAMKAREAAIKQAAIDEFVAQRAAGAETSIQPTPQTGGAGELSEPPKDFAQARAAVSARLAARYGKS